jgi:hypothetical protein
MPTRSIGCFSADKILLADMSSEKIHIPKNKKIFLTFSMFNFINQLISYF